MSRRSKARADRRALRAVPTIADVVPLSATAAQGPVPVGRDITPPNITKWVPTTYAELTWAQVQSIIRLAERGYTMQWVDLTRRMLRSDMHLLSSYESRIDAVAGAPWSLKPPSNTDASRMAMAQRAADDCTWALSQLPIEKLFVHLLDATFTGYAVAEIVWEARGGMVVPADVILHHARRFQFAFDWSLYVWDGGFGGETIGGNRPINAPNGALGPTLRADKFIVHTPMTLPDYPTASGLFQACARPWWVKSWAMKYWLSGAEVAGNPRMLGKYPQSADSATKNALANAIQNLAADAVEVVAVSRSEFAGHLAREAVKWRDIIRNAGITGQQ